MNKVSEVEETCPLCGHSDEYGVSYIEDDGLMQCKECRGRFRSERFGWVNKPLDPDD